MKERRGSTPEPVARPEPAAWAYLVHPSLMPTVFSPGQDVPPGDSSGKVVVRKV